MVEYSEMDSSLATAINQETGRLRFCWGNVISFSNFPFVSSSCLCLLVLSRSLCGNTCLPHFRFAYICSL